MQEMWGFNEVDWAIMLIALMAIGLFTGLVINGHYKIIIDNAQPQYFCDAYWNISMCLPLNMSKANLSNMTMELLQYSANHTWRKNSSLMNACGGTAND